MGLWLGLRLISGFLTLGFLLGFILMVEVDLRFSDFRAAFKVYSCRVEFKDLLLGLIVWFCGFKVGFRADGFRVGLPVCLLACLLAC